MSDFVDQTAGLLSKDVQPQQHLSFESTQHASFPPTMLWRFEVDMLAWVGILHVLLRADILLVRRKGEASRLLAVQAIKQDKIRLS